jgi:glycosyltransferase involved in cell wall biosynthesis
MRQGLENVVLAAKLAEVSDPTLRFVLMGHGSQRAKLEKMGCELSNLAFMDSQSADRFPDILAAADILLVNERASVENMSLPSKLTSYYVAGRPIVVAASERGATAAEARRSGAAVLAVPEEPEALLQSIRELVEDREKYRRLSEAGPIYARKNLDAAQALDRVTEFVGSLMESQGRDASTGN